MPLPARLAALAQQHGIATSFDDWRGRSTEASESTVTAILAAMGITESSDPGPVPSGTASVVSDPHAYLGVPESLGDGPAWGFAVQLYSVRSRRSWGVGDLGDLATLARWSAELGADYILINPLHAAEPVAPLQPSPYLPSSRRFWNPLYIRVEDVPEFAQVDAEEQAVIEALAASVHDELDGAELIDRDTSWNAKRAALELLHRAPRNAERDAAYSAFRELHGDALTGFATWNALAVGHGVDSRLWPEELRDPASAAVAEFATGHPTEIDFEMWLQWVLDEQLESVQATAKAAGMSIGIMHDLAVGVHPGGADAWRNRSVYAGGVRVGAPPDAYNQIGQDWQQPPWRPDRLAERDYAPFRDLIRNVLRHAGGVRIDHIIGLFRLWWIPEGASPAEGTYVRYDHEAFIGILIEEARRVGAVIVGEDLGVVEPSARVYLKEHGILGTSILWFERGQDGEPLPAEQWRELCLASATTHDLPPNAGYLEGVHVELRDRLGLLERPVQEEREADEQDRSSWLAELRRRDLLAGEATVEDTVTALHRYLRLAPSRLLNVALTDAVGDRRTQNQPGTDESQYPNWQIPLSGPDGKPLLLEDVLVSDRAQALAAAIDGR
ncbi:4-alpha-glucanotransferase [Naasia lichenicola]|uniref:4-alpha-glucanotransferase n=1 Tax=Naasia lichenicola TaxID=2565933 RepID=A0A4S4FHY8_9MICO|nr:4-alpha-glucanotransferase [Naasia lichenicola]THG29442.1 4-alpha-glucanotransferase [Naasia lichenicola]